MWPRTFVLPPPPLRRFIENYEMVHSPREVERIGMLFKAIIRFTTYTWVDGVHHLFVFLNDAVQVSWHETTTIIVQCHNRAPGSDQLVMVSVSGDLSHWQVVTTISCQSQGDHEQGDLLRLSEARDLCRHFCHGWVPHGISDIGPNNTFLLAPFHDTSRNNNTINAKVNLSDNVEKVKVNTHPKSSTKFLKAAACWRRSRIDLPRLRLRDVDDDSPERLPGRADNEEGQVISVSRMSRWLLPSRKVKWKSAKYRHRQCCITDCLWEAGAGRGNKIVCVNFYRWPSIRYWAVKTIKITF